MDLRVRQRVAIAIRKGLTYEDLGASKNRPKKRRVSYGVQIRILGGIDTVDVMAVHLKSGCFVDDFSSSDRSACEVLEQQVPVLDHWIEAHVLNEQKFVVLGDFNHRLANKENKMWQILSEIQGVL